MALLALLLNPERIFLAVSVCLVYILFYSISHLSQWQESARWLFTGPKLLAEKYVPGVSFTIQTPERKYTLVSSEASILELSQAKEDQLSLVATAEEVFQPAHTMNGIELNRLGLQHRILRSLTLRLPSYQDPLTALARQALTNELKGKQLDQGWVTLSIFSYAQKAVAKTNTYTFYGEQFTRDAAFLDAAVQYPQDVFVAAEALRCVPKFFAPVMSSIVTRNHRASRHLISKLLPVIKERLDAEEHGNTKGETPRDYIQHIVKLYPDKSPDRALRMVQQTLALWFAGVHQPAMTIFYALVDLCTYPEYIERLRKEIDDSVNSIGSIDINSLLLLDSFLKESARMNASESISLRRKAMVPYHFKDGTSVPLGDWACVPQRAIMRDPSIYANAHVFDGTRFIRNATRLSKIDGVAQSKFTDTSPFYPLWGLGKQACPGRFYAAYIIKIILVEIIQNYDIKLDASPTRRCFTWRSSVLPIPSSTFMIRRRSFSDHNTEPA